MSTGERRPENPTTPRLTHHPKESHMSTLAQTYRQTYRVTGMTCGHCVAAVTEEVGALAGVGDVAVDLTTGRVTVVSDRELTTAQVAAAIDEAGYELAR
jgi:copper ion binding protein